MSFDVNEHPHVRFNPLSKEWVLVSPHRTKRPWKGKVEDSQDEEQPPFDNNNPLCPGVTRPNGITNPNYESTYVFMNDFPALLENTPSPPITDDPLFKSASAQGTCRVMCFHPNSNITISLMSTEEILLVIKRWISELNDLGKTYSWVQIFENKGDIMGCSNPHPHCQIWASSFLPNEPKVKDESQKEFFQKHKKQMLIEYMERELVNKERLVLTNDHWVVVVPYWAVWPYETIVLPRSQVSRMTDLTEDQQKSLAHIMKGLTTKYDNLFKCSFPYSMGWHGAPTGPYINDDCSYWTFHGCYYPPLLRSATVKKFMVGYEMLAQPQRDLTAEQAAQKLRELPEVHYKTKK